MQHPERVVQNLNDDFRTQAAAALARGADLGELWDLLCEFRDKGLPQQAAYEQLKAIRPGLDEETEDRLLEVMDFVVGWCSPHNRVWDGNTTD